MIIEDWRQHLKAVQPHSSFNYLAWNELVVELQNNLPTETRGLSSQWGKLQDRSNDQSRYFELS